MHETRSTIAIQTLSVQPRIVATVAIIGAGTMGTGKALGQTLKKIPVLTRNAFGFIGNCIYNAYRKQCRITDGVVYGHCGCGAIALGHPRGASGVRLATTAVNRLIATGDRSRYARCLLALART
ncbi:MAG: hypothetical protein RL210_1895 [Pseudomonadota bacterium]|jgi:hypothetical protein